MKGNYRGRSDYKGKSGGFSSVTTEGDKGVPPGMSQPASAKTVKSVESVSLAGDKGVGTPKPPGSKGAPLD